MACKSTKTNISKLYKEIGYLLVHYMSEYLTINQSLLAKIIAYSTDINAKKEDLIALLDEYIAFQGECCDGICQKLYYIIILLRKLPCVLEVVPVTVTTTTVITGTTTTTGGETGTTTTVDEGCNVPTTFQDRGAHFPYVASKYLGPDLGLVTITFDTYHIPDKFIIIFDGTTYDLGYRGDSFFQPYLDLALIARGEPTEVISGASTGSFSFIKASSAEYATVEVYAPLATTAFEFTISCPQPYTTTTTTPPTTTTTTLAPTTTTTTASPLPTTTTTTRCFVEYLTCGRYYVMNNTEEDLQIWYKDCYEEEWFGGVLLGAGMSYSFADCVQLKADCLLDVPLITPCTTTTTTVCSTDTQYPLFYRITIAGGATNFYPAYGLAQWAWCEIFVVGGPNKSLTAHVYYSTTSGSVEGQHVWDENCDAPLDGYYIPVYEQDLIVHLESGVITEIFTAECPPT